MKKIPATLGQFAARTNHTGGMVRCTICSKMLSRADQAVKRHSLMHVTEGKITKEQSHREIAKIMGRQFVDYRKTA